MGQTVSRARRWAARLLQALAILMLLAALALTAVVFARNGAAATAGGPAMEAASPIPRPAPAPEALSVPVAAPTAYLPETVEAPVGDPMEYDPGYDYFAPVPLSDAVEEGWFSDAAFLGDSLTEGLLLYTPLRAQGADCLAYRALNVLTVSTKKVISRDGVKLTPVDALEGQAYGKIYLSLGVNELGWYDDDKYYDHYAALIDTVRALQPEADIYLQTLLPVTAEKSESGGYVTNDGIVRFNGLIARLAAEKQVYLLDLHSAFVDGDGALAADWSTDGIHLTRSRYALWLDYLTTHTVAYIRENAPVGKADPKYLPAAGGPYRRGPGGLLPLGAELCQKPGRGAGRGAGGRCEGPVQGGLPAGAGLSENLVLPHSPQREHELFPQKQGAGRL